MNGNDNACLGVSPRKTIRSVFCFFAAIYLAAASGANGDNNLTAPAAGLYDGNQAPSKHETKILLAGGLFLIVLTMTTLRRRAA